MPETSKPRRIGDRGWASIAGIGFGHLLKGRGYKANADYGVE